MRLHWWRKREEDLDAEIESHLDMSARDRAGRGESLVDAARFARRELGSVALVKEVTREMWGWASLERLAQDVRYGLRVLRKSPGFSIFAVLTLALGIGANTAIFSVVNGILLRPLPFRDPARLVAVMEDKPSQGLDWLYATANNFIEWERRSTVFETIGATNGCGYRLADETEPHLLQGTCASAAFLPMLGVQPLLGRFWTPEEDVPGRDHVAVISNSLWKTQFAGDPNVLGKAIWRTSDRESFTIIGVLPPEFQFVNDDTSVWTPLGLPTDPTVRRYHNWSVFARLKPGVTLEQAQSSLTTLARELEREFPQTNTGWGITVRPLQQFFSEQGNARTTLLVLLGAVGMLLLIACANVANLLLARATARRKEIAVRMAIGATRMRLLRQLLTESLLLGLLGGAAGFLLARITFRWLISIVPFIPSFEPHAIRMDIQVLFFTMAASVLASLFFGLTPALRVSRQGLNETLCQSGRGLHGSLRDRFARQLLVVSEIGLAVVLLIGTGLLVESLRNLQNDRLGFNAEHVLTVPFCCLDEIHYPTQPQITAAFKQLFERLRALPGVESVSSTSTLPMRQFDGGGSQFAIQGRPPAEPGHETITDWRIVGPDFFQTLQIPVVRGRVFSEQDDSDHALAAVINESMAQRHFPGQDPTGQQIQLIGLRPTGRWFTIVGIVANSRDRGLGRETRSTLYLPTLQNLTAARGAFLLLRTRPDPVSISADARSAVRSISRDVSIGNIRTLNEALSLSLSPQRFSATLLTLFAALALCLASIGVYGVTSYGVAQRTHEIGVRMALGAQPRDVLNLVIGQGARLALIGVAVGLAGALALTRLMTTLLFGVSPRDPFTVFAVSVVLVGVTLLACYFPARRAMRVDPVIALRYE